MYGVPERRDPWVVVEAAAVTGPTVRSRRADQFDAEEFEAMLASKAWARFAARVEAEARRAHERCTREDGAVELRRAQGAAVALRAVMDLPASILAGLKKSRE